MPVPDIHPNVFLSYSHADKVNDKHKTEVEEIRQLLTSHGIVIKWDEDFRIGKPWELEMKLNLKESMVI